MKKIFNINSQRVVTQLGTGKYSIYVLGGWGVRRGKFSISFENIATNEIIETKLPLFPIQSFAYNTRAKKLFFIHIQEAGEYRIVFHDPDSIVVKRSNLPVFSWFLNPISNLDIRILVTTNNGMSMFID